MIWMKVSRLLIRNTTVMRQRFYVFKMVYWNQSIINNASFSCCWTNQQPSTPSIIRSCYKDFDPGLVQEETGLRGFSLILRIVPSQFRLMDLLLQFVRSGLVCPRGPCWVRWYVSYTRPHWMTLYDGMIWNSIYLLMILNCTHLQLWWWRWSYHYNFPDWKLSCR